MRMHNPPHPGEFIKAPGVSRKTLHDENRGLSPVVDELFISCVGTPPLSERQIS